MADYSAREVAFYLAISHQTAEDIDTAIASSWDYDVAALASLAQGTAAPPSMSAEGPDVLHVLRWADVQRARQTVERRRSVEALQLRVTGISNGSVAQELGVHERTVRKQVRAAVEDILAELGGAPEEPAAVDRVAALLVEISRKVRR